MIHRHSSTMAEGSSATLPFHRLSEPVVCKQPGDNTAKQHTQGVKSQLWIHGEQEMLTWIQLHPSGGTSQLELSDLPQGDQKQTVQSNTRMQCPLSLLCSSPLGASHPLLLRTSITKAHCSLWRPERERDLNWLKPRCEQYKSTARTRL